MEDSETSLLDKKLLHEAKDYLKSTVFCHVLSTPGLQIQATEKSLCIRQCTR